MKLYKSIIDSMNLISILEYSKEITIRNYRNKLIEAIDKDKSSRFLRPSLNEYIQKSSTDGSIEVINDEGVSEVLSSLLSEFEEVDPTPNKSYVPFLAKLYSTDPNAYMYALQVFGSRYLSIYNNAKSKNLLEPQDKDIMKVKTLADLKLIVDKYEDILEEMELSVKGNENAEKVYEDDEVKVIIPHDEAASCYYGRGTKWCTAATKGNNMFDYYNKSEELFILIPKTPKYDGEKYQLHFDSESFTDEKDRKVDIDWLLSTRFTKVASEYFIKKFPDLSRVIIFMDHDKLNDLIKKISKVVMKYVETVKGKSELDLSDRDIFEIHKSLDMNFNELYYTITSFVNANGYDTALLEVSFLPTLLKYSLTESIYSEDYNGSVIGDWLVSHVAVLNTKGEYKVYVSNEPIKRSNYKYDLVEVD